MPESIVLDEKLHLSHLAGMKQMITDIIFNGHSQRRCRRNRAMITSVHVGESFTWWFALPCFLNLDVGDLPFGGFLTHWQQDFESSRHVLLAHSDPLHQLTMPDKTQSCFPWPINSFGTAASPVPCEIIADFVHIVFHAMTRVLA
jgi:hypothetical protein